MSGSTEFDDVIESLRQLHAAEVEVARRVAWRASRSAAGGRLVAALAVLVVAAIGVVFVLSLPGNRSATPPTSPPAGVPAGAPVVDCLNIETATCDRMVTVAVAAVKPSGWTPTHVWLNTGMLAPIPELLFDPSANFPYQTPPDGGQWVGNAEIAFAETDQHAGLQIAAVGPDLEAVLIGYRVPSPGWCSGTCPSASTKDGAFRLELVMPHLDWKASDAITGLAILGFDGSAPTTISGSGHNLIVFSYAEVGGTRKVDPVRTMDCLGRLLEPATPLNQQLSKSGSFGQSVPGSDFVQWFLNGSDIHLPAGTWDITAITNFAEGAGCQGPQHSMHATLQITVTN